jgi:hypothetical protein
MAAPGDNMEEEMMNIINNGTQFIANADEQDVDDGSRYLALENEQENTSEVYIVNILYVNIVYIYIYIYIYLNIYHLFCVHKIFIYYFFYIALWIDNHNGKERKCSRPEKTTGGAVHNIRIQHRDMRTTWST